MTKVAIIQSSYIPWRGYFDIIHDVDIFVFYDCVQYTKRDWRTRNFIKTKVGRMMLTVPVVQAGKIAVDQVEICTQSNWQEKHYRSLVQNYSSRPFFKDFVFLLDEFYKKSNWKRLSEFNQHVIKRISKILNIKTQFVNSRDLCLTGSKNDRLIDALKKLKADIYISGPSAKVYIKEKKFKENNIELVYKDYPQYPQYLQQGNNFEGNVSILDLLFNVGDKAPDYIWGK